LGASPPGGCGAPPPDPPRGLAYAAISAPGPATRAPGSAACLDAIGLLLNPALLPLPLLLLAPSSPANLALGELLTPPPDERPPATPLPPAGGGDGTSGAAACPLPLAPGLTARSPGTLPFAPGLTARSPGTLRAPLPLPLLLLGKRCIIRPPDSGRAPAAGSPSPSSSSCRRGAARPLPGRAAARWLPGPGLLGAELPGPGLLGPGLPLRGLARGLPLRGGPSPVTGGGGASPLAAAAYWLPAGSKEMLLREVPRPPLQAGQHTSLGLPVACGGVACS
jgi:hypothetical protein